MYFTDTDPESFINAIRVVEEKSAGIRPHEKPTSVKELRFKSLVMFFGQELLLRRDISSLSLAASS